MLIAVTGGPEVEKPASGAGIKALTRRFAKGAKPLSLRMLTLNKKTTGIVHDVAYPGIELPFPEKYLIIVVDLIKNAMEAIFGPAYLSFCFSISSSIGNHYFFGFCKDKAKRNRRQQMWAKTLREKRKEKRKKGRKGRQSKEKPRRGCAGFSLMLLSSIVQNRVNHYTGQSSPLYKAGQTTDSWQAARRLCNRLHKQSLKYHGTYRRAPVFFATFALQVHVKSKHKHQ
uniref:hypothetical protein n=1 Tax=Prevotella sp. TaxID=59823 RepID=UPI00402899EF